MAMTGDQLLIGGTTAAICAVGYWRERWLLSQTPKGRWLVRRLGGSKATWLLRVLLAAGLGFGVLLATGVINPIRWSRAAVDARD
ncbi:MAG: hypothetical protein R3B90_20660 [Planctomycetaceae bacterium]